MAGRTAGIEYRGKGRWAALRATLPPKPGSARVRPYVQRITLGISATTADGRRQIKALQKRLEHELLSGTFEWGNWSREHRPKSELSIGELVAALQQHIQATKSIRPTTWEKAYAAVYRLRFPDPSQKLSAEMVIAALAASERSSSVRKRDMTALTALVKFAELDVDLEPYRANYGRKQVRPQDLPSDEAIVAMIDNLPAHLRHVQWICGVLATYGLRPSEIVGLEIADDATLFVHEERKTGRRPVRPLPMEWVERWQLLDRPEIPWKLPSPWSVATNLKSVLPDNGWNHRRYAFRHCYARRCAERGITASVAARMMGHTPLEHELTYRAWVGEKSWIEMFDAQAGN